MADGQQTFDSVQDWVAHRSEERAKAAATAEAGEELENEDLEAGAGDGDAEEVETEISEEADPAFEEGVQASGDAK